MIEISSLLCTGTSLRDNSLTGAFVGATCSSTWGLIVICSSGVIDITLFLFLGIVSFESISLLRFNRGLGSFVMKLFNFLVGISILAEIFAAEICDFVTFVESIKASGN